MDPPRQILLDRSTGGGRAVEAGLHHQRRNRRLSRDLAGGVKDLEHRVGSDMPTAGRPLQSSGNSHHPRPSFPEGRQPAPA